MRLGILTSIVLYFVLPVVVAAQDPRRDEIAAASQRALDSLLQQVSQESIGNQLTVGDLLRKTNGGRRLMNTLARARQIGGPRWLDERTCEVRLDITGPQVARTLVEIATLDNRTPIAPDVLGARLRKWDNRTFSSTGAASVDLTLLDGPRRLASLRARRDAEDQVRHRISSIPLADGKTVGDAMALPAVARSIDRWLDSRPITRVEFPSATDARVTLDAPGDDLFNAFRAATRNEPAATGPMDDAMWKTARDEFISRLGGVSGQAETDESAQPTRIVTLPATPPQWVERQLDADGSAPAQGSQLRAARSAEDAAIEKLRAQVNSLDCGPELTVGDAARQDPRISAAIDRALARTQKSGINYASDGGAQVSVRLDLRHVWDELLSSQP